MIRKCPNCRGLNVRRSSIHVSEVTWQHILLSPYRCRDCRKRFWVLSRNAHYLAGTVVVAIVTGAIAWSVSGILDGPRPDSDWVAPVIGAFADTVKLAEKNDPLAEYKLAQMYAQGYGVARDGKAARTWLERAAEHGNADAQYEFGLALRDGRGIIQDFERAAKWLRQAPPPAEAPGRSMNWDACTSRERASRLTASRPICGSTSPPREGSNAPFRRAMRRCARFHRPKSSRRKPKPAD